MTNQEAIKWLNMYASKPIRWDNCSDDTKTIREKAEVCIQEAFNMAINVLKAQEARVMTLDEVRQAEINSEPLWCELIDCAFGSWRIGWILKTQSRREVHHVIENHFERAIVWESEYGIGWRCWTSRPDEKRRAETPWNAQK